MMVQCAELDGAEKKTVKKKKETDSFVTPNIEIEEAGREWLKRLSTSRM